MRIYIVKGGSIHQTGWVIVEIFDSHEAADAFANKMNDSEDDMWFCVCGYTVKS